MKRIDQRAEHRLQSENNIWVATVRPDGRPHLTPVWFVWHDGKVYICIDPNSVKARNMTRNDRVALALEDGAPSARPTGRKARSTVSSGNTTGIS